MIFIKPQTRENFNIPKHDFRIYFFLMSSLFLIKIYLFEREKEQECLCTSREGDGENLKETPH